jgi:hypothetical protein
MGGLGGVVGKAMGGGANCKNGGIKVPLQIHGTTANPQFVPDVGGAAASLLKSEFSCAGGGGASGVTSAAGALAGGSKGTAADTVNQLGGLFGKKKP